jgi:hypothetical protein
LRVVREIEIVPGATGRGTAIALPPNVSGAAKVVVSGIWENGKNIKVQYTTEPDDTLRATDNPWFDTSGGNIGGTGSYKKQVETLPAAEATWVAVNTVATFTQGDPPVQAWLVCDTGSPS